MHPYEPTPKQLADADRDLAQCNELLDNLTRQHRHVVDRYREHGVHGSTRPIGFHSQALKATIAPHTMAVLLSIALHRSAMAAEAAEKETSRGEQ